MPAHLDIRLFGEPSFRYDDAPFRFVAPPRALPMLAWLILRRERISRSQLAAIFWPDETREGARSNVRRHLHRLAQALPPGVDWLLADPTGVAWNPEAPARIDVTAFEDGDGIDVYGGDLLPECYDEPIVAARERLRSLYLERCLERAAAARRERRFADADRLIDRVFAVDPLREGALRLAMSVRYEAGDRTAALAAYDRFAAALRAEMRVEPMPETRALRDAIVANDPIASPVTPQIERALPRGYQPLPFAGRERELEDVRAAWRRAAGGRGGVVFVAGEAGMGKSRLVAELALAVDAEGGRMLAGSTSTPQTQPYQVFVEALRRGLALIADADVEFVWLSALAALVPEIGELVPGLPDAPPLDGDGARRRLFEAVVRCFAEIARARPFLLVLEDLHWADPAVVDLLETLARRIGALPMLVVATYRSDEVEAGSPLGRTRAALQREHRASTVHLRPLERADVDRIVELAASIDRAPQALAERLFHYSAGSPLFVAQLLRDFVESGSLPDDPTALLSLRDVVLARVERLGPDVRAMLEAASIVGNAFSFETIAGAGGWRDFEVLDGLGTLVERSLVREIGRSGTDYTFAHALIRNAVYDSLDPDLRRARHGRIAASLARLPAYAASPALGSHWERAGIPDRAHAVYLASARAALDVFARAAAAPDAARALATASDDAGIFEACLIGARALLLSGDAERCKGYLLQARAASAGISPRRRYELAEESQRFWRQVTDVDAETAAIDEMMDLAREVGDAALEVRAFDARGCNQVMAGDIAASIATFREGTEIAVRAGASDAEEIIRVDLVHALARSGDIAGAQAEIAIQRARMSPDAPVARRIHMLLAEGALAETLEDGPGQGRAGRELAEIGIASGSLHAEAMGSWMLSQCARFAGDIEGMRTYAERAYDLFGTLNTVRPQAGIAINLAMFERDRGDLAAAHGYAARTASLNVRAADVASALAALYAELYVLEGDFARARASADEALTLARTTGEPGTCVVALVAAGAAARGDGSLADARALLEEARDLVLASGTGRVMLADALALLVETTLDLGERDRADAFAGELAGLMASEGDARSVSPRIAKALARAGKSS